jgi:hypothetical protein
MKIVRGKTGEYILLSKMLPGQFFLFGNRLCQILKWTLTGCEIMDWEKETADIIANGTVERVVVTEIHYRQGPL